MSARDGERGFTPTQHSDNSNRAKLQELQLYGKTTEPQPVSSLKKFAILQKNEPLSSLVV